MIKAREHGEKKKRQLHVGIKWKCKRKLYRSLKKKAYSFFKVLLASSRYSFLIYLTPFVLDFPLLFPLSCHYD